MSLAKRASRKREEYDARGDNEHERTPAFWISCVVGTAAVLLFAPVQGGEKQGFPMTTSGPLSGMQTKLIHSGHARIHGSVLHVYELWIGENGAKAQFVEIEPGGLKPCPPVKDGLHLLRFPTRRLSLLSRHWHLQVRCGIIARW